MYTINYRSGYGDNWKVYPGTYSIMGANEQSKNLIEQGYKTRLVFISEWRM